AALLDLHGLAEADEQPRHRRLQLRPLPFRQLEHDVPPEHVAVPGERAVVVADFEGCGGLARPVDLAHLSTSCCVRQMPVFILHTHLCQVSSICATIAGRSRSWPRSTARAAVASPRWAECSASAAGRCG